GSHQSDLPRPERRPVGAKPGHGRLRQRGRRLSANDLEGGASASSAESAGARGGDQQVAAGLERVAGDAAREVEAVAPGPAGVGEAAAEGLKPGALGCLAVVLGRLWTPELGLSPATLLYDGAAHA